MTTTAPAPGRDTARPKSPRWLTLLALLVALGIAAAICAVIVTRDDAPSDPSSAAQLSQVQASCDDWMASSQADGQADTQADRQWCTDMFAWMSDQSGGSMMGSMMWQGPEQLGKACHDWVSQDRADSGASGQQRCRDMVEWMDGHMSSRGGNWMMPGR